MRIGYQIMFTFFAVLFAAGLVLVIAQPQADRGIGTLSASGRTYFVKEIMLPENGIVTFKTTDGSVMTVTGYSIMWKSGPQYVKEIK